MAIEPSCDRSSEVWFVDFESFGTGFAAGVERGRWWACCCKGCYVAALAVKHVFFAGYSDGSGDGEGEGPDFEAEFEGEEGEEGECCGGSWACSHAARYLPNKPNSISLGHF